MDWKISKDAVAFIFGVHKWGAKATGNKEEITTGADKARLGLTKKLIDSKQYKAISDYLQDTKNWVIARSVPIFFREGCYLFKLGMVEVVADELEARAAMLEILVEEFLAIYPQQVKEAQLALGPQFRPSDYPDVESLRRRFYWSSQWITFNVPEGLPERIREQEKAKAENMWESAAEQITLALRESFRELIAHAADKLTPDADGKRKIYRDSTITNITEFLENFQNRNITNDLELEKLVGQAQAVLGGIDGVDVLRKDEGVREVVKEQFEKLTAAVDELIVKEPRRKFYSD
jgi:hypothetical protein